MSKEKKSSPTVYISYSNDSKRHRQMVMELSNRLRKDGIDAEIDQYEMSPLEGKPKWMEKQIRCSDFIIFVCSLSYLEALNDIVAHGERKDEKWEGSLIYNFIYQNDSKNSRIIPVVFSPDQKKHIPQILKSNPCYVLETEIRNKGRARKIP